MSIASQLRYIVLECEVKQNVNFLDEKTIIITESCWNQFSSTEH